MGSPRARHAAAGALIAAAAWLTLYTGWLLLAPWGDRGLLVFGNTAYLVPVVAATLLAGWAAARDPGPLRAFWGLIALGCASWAAGETVWSVVELRDGQVPFPWWPDVGYLGFYGCVLLALVAFFRPTVRSISVQALLDAVLTVAALVLCWWWLVLRDVELGADAVSLVGVSYPLLDLLILCTVAGTRFVAARRGSPAVWLVAAAAACAAVSDSVYTRLAVDGEYRSGTLLDLGWQLEAVLLCLAAVASLLGLGRGARWDQHRSPIKVRTGLSMSIALVSVVGVLVADGVAGALEPNTVVLVCAVAALLLARGWLLLLATQRDSARRDPLTGVYDAPHLEDQLRRLAAAARQYDEPFALVFLRVPRRSEPDAVHRLVRTARELDLVAKREHGGLAVVLPRTSSVGAHEAAERLRRATGCSAAAGVAVWRRGDTASDVSIRADELLRAAVVLGGNHTRGPERDVLVDGHEDLSATAFVQLVRLAGATDARWEIAPAHSRKVARLASDIARELGLDEEGVVTCYLGGLLHAVGTLALDDEALHPHRGFAMLDAKLEVRHGSRGADFVRKIRCAEHVAPVVAAFEEHWDGSGPRRLRGETIPFEARIVAVANAITTMTEPGGDALPLTSALSEIWRLAGGRFDPEVVSALFRLVRDGRIAEAIEDELLATA